MSSLKLITKVQAANIPVSKYKSELTGLTVVIAEVKGPLVNGFFTLVTEAHDDDGLPHTLEHLIFLGSELYPYKGVLDLLANRCLASGTNAWTDTDHTCYTMKTVGKDGFLELMPIYLDHILYPTLSDSAFITEVHHITPEGEDSGVVYCEMQGRENSGESRAFLELIRAIYPNSGYSAETGGIMHNLRTSTNNEKVRKYHAEFYRPENLTLVITGEVDIKDVARALEPFEKRILQKPKKPEFERPWQTPIPPIEEALNKKILYQSDCEDCGLVFIGWRGPNCTKQNLKLTACSVLLRYLSETAVSPLQRELVEIDDPYASHVSYNIVENYEALLYFGFENVPIQKIDGVWNKVKAILGNLAEGEEKFDMQRIHNILERCILEYFSNLESNPHETIAFTAIADALYGEKEEDLETRLNVTKQMKHLLTRDEAFWRELLTTYLTNDKYVVIRAVPSVEEQKRMAKDEMTRVEKQREALGPDGLLQKGEELNHAMATNEIPPPSEMLTQVPIPDITHIKSLPSSLLERSDGSENKLGELDLNKFPVQITACEINTTFGYLMVYCNTNTLPAGLRQYLLLFMELLTESPIRNPVTNELMPYEDVVTALESDTISIQTSLGLECSKQFSCGSYSHTAVLMMKVDYRKYVRGIQWIVDLLNHTEFTIERLRVCGAKIANAVAQAKRNGNAVTHDLLKAMFYAPGTNVRQCSMINQYRLLNSLLEKLDDDSYVKAIINNLNELRSEITSTNRLSLYLAADWSKISPNQENFYENWGSLIKSGDTFDYNNYEHPVSDYRLRKEVISPSQVLGMGCIEGAFLCHAVHCPIDIHHEAYMPLMLFMQYLTQLEGPFWRQIRGQGLAYGYQMYVNLHEQLLYFTLYRATNVISAFNQFKSITEAQLSPNATWEPKFLESAKSSLIFEFMEREKSIDDVILQNFISNCFYRTNRISDLNQMNIRKISKVTIEDMESVGKQFVSKLFSSDARTAIVCHPDKAAEVSAGFNKFDFNLTVATSIEDSVLGQIDV